MRAAWDMPELQIVHVNEVKGGASTAAYMREGGGATLFSAPIAAGSPRAAETVRVRGAPVDGPAAVRVRPSESEGVDGPAAAGPLKGNETRPPGAVLRVVRTRLFANGRRGFKFFPPP